MNGTTGSTETLNFSNVGMNVDFMLNQPTQVTVVNETSNTTLAKLPGNATTLKTLGITLLGQNGTALNITLNVTIHYNCSVPSGRVAPYIMVNGAWVAITPFVVNAAACTVSFSIPSDPIIAIGEAPVPPSTTVTPTMTATPTSTTSTPSNSGSATTWIVGVIVVIVIVVVVWAMMRKKSYKGLHK